MEKKMKNSKTTFVEMLVKLFSGIDPDKFSDDMSKAKNLTEKPKFINSFLKNYSDSKLDNETLNRMLYDIISQIVKTRRDFGLCMEIYMILDDPKKADTLKNHYILKKKIEKVENGDTSTFGKFEINLSCVYDIESYYHKFIKGIFHYFQLSFKENYLYEYIKYDYFQNYTKSKYYKDNTTSLEISLENMLIDINRVIAEHLIEETNQIPQISKSKMTKQKFGIFQIKANLQLNKEIGEIYNKAKNNDDILNEVNELIKKIEDTKGEENDKEKKNELYSKLVIFQDSLESYIKTENNNSKIIELEKSGAYNNMEIYESKKENKNLKAEINELKNEIVELKKENRDLRNEVKGLREKVEFMEPIVLSLICRKAINHSIIQILKKYKKKIKVTE